MRVGAGVEDMFSGLSKNEEEVGSAVVKPNFGMSSPFNHDNNPGVAPNVAFEVVDPNVGAPSDLAVEDDDSGGVPSMDL